MDSQELTDTGIIRIQRAANEANDRFIAHFTSLLTHRDPQIDVEFCAGDIVCEQLQVAA